MKPVWFRLEPTAAETYEIRWVVPTHQRGDVMIRRFRRERDALAYAEKLRTFKGVYDVRVWRAPVGRWRELPLPEFVDDGSAPKWGAWD